MKNSDIKIYTFLYFQKGEYRPVSDVEQLREMMATFYSRPAFTTNSALHAIYTVPYHDGFGFGTYKLQCLYMRGFQFLDKRVLTDLLCFNRVYTVTELNKTSVALQNQYEIPLNKYVTFSNPEYRSNLYKICFEVMNSEFIKLLLACVPRCSSSFEFN